MTSDAIVRAERTLGRPVSVVRTLGHGTDHTAVEIEGDLVVRIGLEHGQQAAERIEREARLLALIRPFVPTAVPEVVAADPSEGVLIVTKLPGVSLLDRPSPEPQRLVPRLAALLTALREIPTERADGIVAGDDFDPGAWLDDTADSYGRVAPELDRAQRQAIEQFLAEPPPTPTDEHVLCHNDLGAEHLLADDHHDLIGVIDWSDAAITDQAADLGRLARDLGPSVAAEVAARLGLDERSLQRAAFYARCTLIEDIAHGLQSGDHRYSRAALAHFSRTFQWSPT
jgi:aminoglycoside phosphotransferase (APT) family kinase protein